MQKSRHGVPKTIQSKYLTSHSQTWNKVDAPPTSPRLIKRKSRMNSYSAQTWLDSEKNAAGKLRPMRTVSSQPSQPMPNRCCPFRRPVHGRGPQYGFNWRNNRQPPPQVRRPDPSAPHLKYGLFNNPRKPVIIGGLANALASRQSLKKPSPTELARNYRIRQRKEVEGEVEDTEEHQDTTPQLLFRSLLHRYSNRLSASDVNHLDIKPGRRSINSPVSPRVTVM